MNLRLFEKAVSDFSGEEEDFPTWKVAFKRIGEFAKDERFLLAIDDFADLVSDISKIEGDYKLRFMTSHPKDCTKEYLTLACSDGTACDFDTIDKCEEKYSYSDCSCSVPPCYRLRIHREASLPDKLGFIPGFE